MTLSKHVCHQVNGACPSRLAGGGGSAKNTNTNTSIIFSLSCGYISYTWLVTVCAWGDKEGNDFTVTACLSMPLALASNLPTFSELMIYTQCSCAGAGVVTTQDYDLSLCGAGSAVCTVAMWRMHNYNI